jgi:CspA family cold shock protein
MLRVAFQHPTDRGHCARILGRHKRDKGSRVIKMTDQGQQGGTELRGRIKWFNPEKGFGFVSPADGAPDVFLHISALKEAGLQDAPEGSTIHCQVGQGRKGIQVLRVITLDTSTATPRQQSRRPFGGGGGGPRHDRGPRHDDH